MPVEELTRYEVAVLDVQTPTLVRGVRIFKVGKFTDSQGNKREWTAEDLAEAVANFTALREAQILPNVPMRVDHTTSMRDVVGYIEGLFFDGTYLTADFNFTEPEAAAKYERGTYRNRSVEIGNYKDNTGRVWKNTVVGVAFVDLPAVEGLYRAFAAAVGVAERATIPEDVQNAAAEALASGVKGSAKDLAAAERLSRGGTCGEDFLREMLRVTSSVDSADPAWLLWGGDTARSWVAEAVSALDESNPLRPDPTTGAGQGAENMPKTAAELEAEAAAGQPPATPPAATPPAATPPAVEPPAAHQAPQVQVHTYTIAGRTETDPAKVQEHIAGLETFQKETLNAARTGYVDSLAAAGKIVAAQAEGMKALVLTFTTEQFDQFKAGYDAAGPLNLFAKHEGAGNGTPPPAGESAITELETAREVVANHRRGGMSEEDVQQTSSYKRMIALEAAASNGGK